MGRTDARVRGPGSLLLNASWKFPPTRCAIHLLIQPSTCWSASLRNSLIDRHVRSLTAAKAPPHILAALELFRLQNPSADRLLSLSEKEQIQFLTWCDTRQLSLLSTQVSGLALPGWLTEAVSAKAARYQLRFERLRRDLFEIAEAFNASGLDFVLLKGLSHSPALTPDPRARAQGDIDLWLTGTDVYKAQSLLERLGYVPLLAEIGRASCRERV